jgi:hypothetical protein
MLTQLSTVKDRLAIAPATTTYDTLLTSAIKAVSTPFDKLTNRTLARTVGTTQEFPADKTELILSCFPLETVTKLELKSTEAEGWVEQTGIDHLIRNACIVSLSSRLGTWRDQGRITYVGGYVLPGTAPALAKPPCPTTSNKPPSNRWHTGFATKIPSASSATGPPAEPTGSS